MSRLPLFLIRSRQCVDLALDHRGVDMNFVHVLPQALEIGTYAGNTFAYVPHHLLKDGHSSFKACLRRAAAATGYPEAGKGNHVWGFALSGQFRRSIVGGLTATGPSSSRI